MAAFLDNCRFTASAGGTTDWTFAAAITGYQTPTLAGASNGLKYKFMAMSSDQSQWEIAEGAYNSSTGVFARTTVLYNSSGTGTAGGQSGAGSKINFTSAPQVAIIGIKEDLLAFDELNSFTSAQQELARVNLVASRIVGFSGTIVESHSAGAVTFAVKTVTGNDPSVATPVIFAFPNGSGGVSYVSVTAPLSITVPSGATLGQTNAVAFRLWVAAFNDGGTVRLAVRTNSVGKLGFTRPSETKSQSSTLTPGNSGNVFYTTGAAVTSKYWMWIAHATYESGLATVGTWAVSPDVIAIVDASSPRPGDVVQEVINPGPSGALSLTDTSGPYDMITLSITPMSAANNMALDGISLLYLRTGTSGAQATTQISNGSTSIVPNISQAYEQDNTYDRIHTVPLDAVDRPNTTSSVTYKMQARNVAIGGGVIQYYAWNFRAREIYT